MTFTAVGSFAQTTTTTLALNPAKTGNFYLVSVLCETSTVYCSSISGGNCTWSTVGSKFPGSNNAGYATLFIGKAAAVGPANATLAFSGTTPTFEAVAQQFSSTAGAWAQDGPQGTLDLVTGTSTWPSLTPSGSGDLYFGFFSDSGTATAGSTSGYTYDVNSNGDGLAFNPDCSAAAQAPVWGDSGQTFGVAILLRETPSGPSSHAVQVRQPQKKFSRGLLYSSPAASPRSYSTGLISASYGTPPQNLTAGPPVYPAQGPVRARLHQLPVLRGRTGSNPGFQGKTYYVSPGGSNSNNGLSTTTAWQTIAKVNSAPLPAGSTVLFQGGQSFTDATLTPSVAGLTFGSYGAGNATLAYASGSGIYAHEAGGITVENLIITGPGAATAGADGYVGIYFLRDIPGYAPGGGITVSGCTITGWADGILAGAADAAGGYSGITITGNSVSANRDAGINVYGSGYSHQNVTITGNTVFNQTGYSGNTTTSSGHGIVVGNASGGTIAQNVTYGNGASCGCTTAGPVGNWAYSSQNLVIENNVSYQNKTASPGNSDGDGFDLDDQCVNCTLQYNIAYENDGAGIACYSDDSTWSGNVIRYNITWGNSVTNPDEAEIMFTGGAFANCEVYGNTFIGQTNAELPSVVLLYGASFTSVNLWNNIFYTAASGVAIIYSDTNYSGITFQGNLYYSAAPFVINWGGSDYSSLAAWRTGTSQEILSAVNTGVQANPRFIAPGTAPAVTSPSNLAPAYGLQLASGSPGIAQGLNLSLDFSVTPGPQDFFGNSIGNPLWIGAYQGTPITWRSSPIRARIPQNAPRGRIYSNPGFAALLLTNTFAGGTNTTTITTGNSGGVSGNAFTTVTIGAGAFATYSNTTAVPSAGTTLSGEIQSGSTGSQVDVQWGPAVLGKQALVYASFYIQVTAYPASTDKILALESSQGGALAALRVNSSKQLLVQDSLGNTLHTFANLISPGVWFRVETSWAFTGARNAGQVTARLFNPGNSQVPVEQYTSSPDQNFGGSTCSIIQFGWITSKPNEVSYLGNLNVNNYGFPGPASLSGPASLGHPVSAVTRPLPPRGRISSNRGHYTPGPTAGPVFRPATSPSRIHPALPPRGRLGFSRGAPVVNPPPPPPPPVVPRTLPSFNSVPGLMAPGLAFPGEPVNFGVRWFYNGITPLLYLDYLDADTRDTLYVIPGGNYQILIANTRAGLTIPPNDGRWLVDDPVDEVPLHRRLFLKLREHVHKSRRRSGYRNPGTKPPATISAPEKITPPVKVTLDAPLQQENNPYPAIPGMFRPGEALPGNTAFTGFVPGTWQYIGQQPVYYLDYLDQDARATLSVDPGGTYRILVANTRAGLVIPPADGNWLGE